MESIKAYLIGNQTNPLLARELLGRPVQAYALAALNEACPGNVSMLMTPQEKTGLIASLQAETAQKIVFVRADSATAEPQGVYTLCAQASANQDEMFAITIPGTQTLLALCSDRELLLRTLDGATLDSLQDLLPLLAKQDVHLRAIPVPSPVKCIAVDSPRSFAAAHAALRQDILDKLLDAGVIILDPERTIIEADVQIGAGTIVYPGNLLMGKTVIGAGCTLWQNNRLQNATVGDGTTVESSVLLNCAVGAKTTVGPYAYVRPDSNVGDGCRIGDFVEIKNSKIGNGTKVSHLTYVGDSDLGEHINLGCGVVFVNYDGKTKSRSTVADHAFIGCNCNLVAPVHVGENAYIAAGSTITEDVPADALYVARSRGTTKENWVSKRKEQGKL